MKLLVHDLAENPFPNLGDDVEIISTREKAAPCWGCFGCWTKNAGYCVYADSLQHSGAAAGNSEEIIVVSELCYGGIARRSSVFLTGVFPTARRFLPIGTGKHTT